MVEVKYWSHIGLMHKDRKKPPGPIFFARAWDSYYICAASHFQPISLPHLFERNKSFLFYPFIIRLIKSPRGFTLDTYNFLEGLSDFYEMFIVYFRIISKMRNKCCVNHPKRISLFCMTEVKAFWFSLPLHQQLFPSVTIVWSSLLFYTPGI